MKTFSQMLLQFAMGFFGALAGTMVLGFVVLGFLTFAAPNWESTWAHAGYRDKALWIGIPLALAFTAIVMGLWRMRRMIAVGVIAFAALEIVVFWLGG